MSRVVKSLFTCVLFWCLLVILLIAAPAQAITYQLTATATDSARNMFGPGQGFGDFSLKYNADGDGLFHVSELVPGSFSGVSLYGYPVFDVLTGAAGIQDDSPFTDEPSTNSDPNNTYRSWTFETSEGQWGSSAGGFNWTYQREIVSSESAAKNLAPVLRHASTRPVVGA
jgi:hypothetical protein